MSFVMDEELVASGSWAEGHCLLSHHMPSRTDSFDIIITTF